MLNLKSVALGEIYQDFSDLRCCFNQDDRNDWDFEFLIFSKFKSTVYHLNFT